jgi:hypothetical protein
LRGNVELVVGLQAVSRPRAYRVGLGEFAGQRRVQRDRDLNEGAVRGSRIAGRPCQRFRFLLLGIVRRLGWRILRRLFPTPWARQLIGQEAWAVQLNKEGPSRDVRQEYIRAGRRHSLPQVEKKQFVAEIVDDALHERCFAGAAMARDQKCPPGDLLLHVSPHLGQQNPVGLGLHERSPAGPRPITEPLLDPERLV